MEWLYGRRAVLEALRAGRRRIQQLCIADSAQSAGIVAEIIDAANVRHVQVLEVARPTLDQRVGRVNHQGVIARADAFPSIGLDEALALERGEERLFLVLDHLQDVQNLGTLLRTAEAMAVTAVLLPDRRSAGITPAVVNASAGAVEHLPVALVGNLAQAFGRLKEAGVWVVGLDAGPDAIDLGSADLTGALALVVGSEGPGLGRLVREQCDWLLAIPMYGKVASLNAAVAGSVALVAVRQARSRSDG